MTFRFCAASSGNFFPGLKMESMLVPRLFIEKLPCRGLRLMENCSVVTKEGKTYIYK